MKVDAVLRRLETDGMVEVDALDRVQKEYPELAATVILDMRYAAGRIDIGDEDRAAHWAVRQNPTVALLALARRDVREITDAAGESVAHVAVVRSEQAAQFALSDAAIWKLTDGEGRTVGERAARRWKSAARRVLDERLHDDLPPGPGRQLRESAEWKVGWA